MVTFRTSASAAATLYVAGMVGRDLDGGPVNGLGEQTEHALRRISAVLRDEALTLEHIVRLRIYMTDASRWASDVIPRLATVFGDVLPPTTVVQIAALVERWMEIEIDAEASIP